MAARKKSVRKTKRARRKRKEVGITEACVFAVQQEPVLCCRLAEQILKKAARNYFKSLESSESARRSGEARVLKAIEKAVGDLRTAAVFWAQSEAALIAVL